MFYKSLVCCIGLALSHLCFAQTFENNMNSYETPLGMSNVTEIGAPVTSVRDSNFNRTSVNAPINNFSITSIGNLVNVQTNGNNNTIVVNADQKNYGQQNATFGMAPSDGTSSTTSSTN